MEICCCSEFRVRTIGDHLITVWLRNFRMFQNVSEYVRYYFRYFNFFRYFFYFRYSLDQGSEAPKAPEPAPKAAGYNGRATGAAEQRAAESREQIPFEQKFSAITQRRHLVQGIYPENCCRRGSSCLWLSRQRHLAFQHPCLALEFTRIH